MKTFKAAIGVLAISAVFILLSVRPVAAEYDEWGYNETANNFNGTGWSWCKAGGHSDEWCTSYLGTSINDKLVMKWTDDWDRGNEEGWTGTYEHAWTNNQWNGMDGGSGSVWHYRFRWIGDCGDYGDPTGDGGYCIWGQFETIMDQGTFEGAHQWLAHATPAGYGSHN